MSNGNDPGKNDPGSPGKEPGKGNKPGPTPDDAHEPPPQILIAAAVGGLVGGLVGALIGGCRRR
jgi:hypothetical protein